MSAPSNRAFEFKPVIIIGAARSGTNMLRDALTQLPHIATWPCDEINYVWRHHHATFPTDELRSEHATTRVRAYIRSMFSKRARQTRARWIVEKTCANSLRVDFVRAVLPEAKFIFLVRDGRDVVASAIKRWHAKLDLAYTLKKARFVPPSDVPYYAWRFICHRAHRLRSRERRLASWGPRFTGIDDLLRTCALPEVCAEQWRTSVETAAQGLAKFPSGRLHTVRYEDFVRRPLAEFRRITDFLNMPPSTDNVATILNGISTSSVGNWRSQLDGETKKLVADRLRPTLDKWEYWRCDLAATSTPTFHAA